MTQSPRRILFLNQYFPPDPAPTGVLLKEIGADLAEQGYECSFVSATQDYRAANPVRNRMARELLALGTILLKSLKGRRPSLVISGSSPPCMALVAALVARFHRAKAIHWAMDVYPELALELGEIKPGLLVKVIGRAMRWAYQCTNCVVALDEDMAKRLDSYRVVPKIVRPWLPGAQQIPAPLAAEASGVWIYSGNLGRAHEWETLLAAQALLEKRGSPLRLVFQGGGASWKPAQERARQLGLRQCEWRPYAEEHQLRASLNAAGAIIVTQKKETQGLLWPSKLALAMDLQRPILWVGPKGAVTELLSKSPFSGIFEPGDASGVADWLESLPIHGVEKICDGPAHRQQSLAIWREIVGM